MASNSIPRNVWLVTGIYAHPLPAGRGLYWEYYRTKRRAEEALRVKRRAFPDEPHALVKYVRTETSDGE